MIMKDIKFIREDLFYELRMLLGAANVIELLDGGKKDNLINYFKDSVYLHSRNLYNFFSNGGRNDAHVEDYSAHDFDCSLYKKKDKDNKTWEDALHNHVLHIKNTRINPNNIIDGKHLNEMPLEFVEDIQRLWKKWIEVTTDTQMKNELSSRLKKAQDLARGDCDQLHKLLFFNKPFDL